MLSEAVVELATYSVTLFALALLLSQVVAKEVGYYFGHRRAQREAGAGEGVGVVVSGMLGMLAFVLALTLSFANTRFQERRQGTLDEANAIGTAWLQAQAIGHPRGTEVARLLEEYAAQRRDFVRAGRLDASVELTTRRSNALQSEIWGHLSAIVRERPDPVAASLMNALNTTFDLATAERFAFALTFPAQLFWLLVGMSALSMAALGFQLGLRQKPVRVLTLLMIAMWTATTTVILDMGSARVGNFRIGTQAYEWTMQGFQGGITIPPAPSR